MPLLTLLDPTVNGIFPTPLPRAYSFGCDTFTTGMVVVSNRMLECVTAALLELNLRAIFDGVCMSWSCYQKSISSKLKDAKDDAQARNGYERARKKCY